MFIFSKAMVLSELLLLTVLVLSLLAFIISAVWTRHLEKHLRRTGRFDIPNARSSHRVPTPRGGGLAVMGTVGLGFILVGAGGLAIVHIFAKEHAGHFGYNPFSILSKQESWAIAVCMMLAILGYYDDQQGLSARLRLGVQVALIAPAGWYFAPLWLNAVTVSGAASLILIILIWVWMVNLTNFMDGIDGISGVQSACTMVGIIGIYCFTFPVSIFGLIIAPLILGAVLGFLIFNWHPARIFLGDVGSIPLGFITGYLLLELLASKGWLPILILPLYYIADATITLVRRGLRGEKIWQAHRSHFYQRAVSAGRSHAQVARAVLYCDLVLIACAWGAAAAAKNPQIKAVCAAIAVVSVATLLYWLSRKPHVSQS